jgi:hypothetical protein
LLHAYSRVVGLEDYAKLIQTDLEEDKTVLDAIAAAGQWHADRFPFSLLGEIGANGETKGLGIAGKKKVRERASMIALAITFAQRGREEIAPPSCLPLQGKASWLKLVQLVGEPPETLLSPSV